MIDWLKKKLAWACLSVSVGLAGIQLVTPELIDPLLDLANVALVAAAIRLKR